MKHEPDPMEQIDYGYGYKAKNSPQQHTTVKIEGGTIALAFAILSFGGVIVGAITIPQMVRSTAEAAAAPAYQKASYAERDARVALDKLQTAQVALAKKGIDVNFDEH